MITNAISLEQQFISRHHIYSDKSQVQEKSKAAKLFVSYVFEKSLNRNLENNKTSFTGDPLSRGSLLARQQMNAEIAKLIAQSSPITTSVEKQLK
ncbi:hypothetical protein [Photobacterium damselae]|uniref:hypothetical protein n=1 Tax=Photobacterium damselae TaxID=38293 RepID=UPI001F30C9F5|nr:hypothetical protein [Photobacterium damselae]UKA04619.1 hypothetical protein IHC89_23660 [Photobacterium damselae subsp. damselae]